MKFSDKHEYSLETSFNIDIEFWDVSYINIPNTLNNLEIKQISEKLLPTHIDESLCNYDRKIFEFSIDSRKHYIIAGGLLIGINHWENEDRIFNFNLNLEHDKILIKV